MIEIFRDVLQQMMESEPDAKSLYDVDISPDLVSKISNGDVPEQGAFPLRGGQKTAKALCTKTGGFVGLLGASDAVQVSRRTAPS